MATRFYLPSTGAAAVSPGYAAWTQTAYADRRAMVRTKISSAMANNVVTDEVAIGSTYLWRQYVSEPISAQTVSGTVKGQVRCSETNALSNHDQVSLCIKVYSNDGATLRGTLLSLGQYGTTNEYSLETTRTSRKMADGDALSSVAASTGDRLVVEIGTRPSTLPTSFDDPIIAVFGDDSGTDLPEDETTTATNNPWIEFSGTIFFDQTTSPTAVNGVGAALAGALIIGAIAVNSVGMASGINNVTVSVLAAQCVGAPVIPASAGVVADSYNPEAVVSQTGGIIGPIRPTTPASLGDGNLSTGETSGDILGAQAGTSTLKATVVGDVVDDGSAIDYLVAHGHVYVEDTVLGGYTLLPLTATRFVVNLAAGETEWFPSDATMPAPGIRKDFVSPNMTTRPGGGAWTWADVNALTGLGMRAAYSLNTNEMAHWTLFEVWAEVFTKQGSQVTPLTKRLRAGNLKRQFSIAESFNL